MLVYPTIEVFVAENFEAVCFLSVASATLFLIFCEDINMDEKNQVCCFTGHRIIKKNDLPKLKTNLQNAIIELIDNGVNTFYAGGALGFDMLAALQVLELKKDYDIQLNLELPCKNQTEKWKKQSDIDIYNYIVQQADEVHYFSDVYTKTCMLDRNRSMVDKSAHCICYLTKNFGGTAYTHKYAVKNNLTIINLAEKTYK